MRLRSTRRRIKVARASSGVERAIILAARNSVRTVPRRSPDGSGERGIPARFRLRTARALHDRLRQKGTLAGWPVLPSRLGMH
jgi:hypothetical protein